MRILFADRDANFRKNFIEKAITNGINIDETDNGIEAKELYKLNVYDVAILEDNLTHMDGITLTKDFKSTRNNIFIIIVSNRNGDFEQNYAYKAGANDYLCKPVNIDNLLLKISNLFCLNQSKLLHIGGLDINVDGRILYVDGEKKNLTLKEFQLLEYLIRYRGKAVSREQIFKDVWEYDDFSTDDRTIDTHIKMLRNELGPYKSYIETYRGYGYKFEVK